MPCGNRIYEFRPNAAGHYVCEVLDDNDRAAILSISAGYKPYAPDEHALRVLQQSYAGLAGIDSGELSEDLKTKDEENARAGKAAKGSVPVPPKMRDVDTSAPVAG